MAFWDRVRSAAARLFTRSSPTLADMPTGILGAGSNGRGPAKRGTAELIAAYREQPWLRAVVGRIARGVASARWSIYVRTEAPTKDRAGRRQRRGPRRSFQDVAGVKSFAWGRDFSVRDAALVHGDTEDRAARRRELAAAGLLREVPDHPLLELLARPNPDMTGRQGLQVTQIWLDVKGEAFWLLDRPEAPTAYYPIPPHWVTQVPTATADHYVVSFGGLQLKVKPSCMIWMRDPDPSNPYGRGTGVAESLGDELETDEFAAKYLKAWFYNSAAPSFIAAFDGATQQDVKRAKELWEQEHRGAHNAHRVHFSNGKMNAMRLDASFRDQEIIDLRRLSRDTTAQVFGVPPEMIGIIENSNRSTIDAARFIFALGVEHPRCELLRTELQHRLVPLFDDALCLEVEVSIPDDEDRRLEVLKAMPGAFALNEWRAEAGYDPEPQFDGVFPPLALPGQTPGAGEPKPSPTPAEPSDSDPEDAADPALPSMNDSADPPWTRSGMLVSS